MHVLVAAEEAKNVLALSTDELIIGLVAFLLVFALLAKLAFPNIKKTLNERVDAIEGGLQRADTAQAEAAALLAQYREQLAEARNDAANIRAAAAADKAAMIDEARSEAAAAAAAVTARAEANMAAERAAVMSSLTREVGDLAIDLAGKVVGESLDDDARARGTVDRFLADLEARADV
jgi:F-type H+-transporting ATPase subunit b